MPRGPLPNANARRTNKPTVAPTVLPAEGRGGRAPAVPKAYKLGKHGAAWWRWAWKLPQATQWDAGTVYFAARRAQLEDDLAAIKRDDQVDLEDLLAGADPEAIKRVEFALGALVRVASGTKSLMSEMRELDNRLGLNPKALLDLRWTIAEPQPAAAPAGGDVAQIADYRDRLG